MNAERFSKYYRFFIVLAVLVSVLSAEVSAQSTTVRGRVVDAETKEPLISAAVAFAGTTSGTNTDFDGFYALSSDNASDTLVVSYLGYADAFIPIKMGKEQTVNVKLEENAVTLTEAVVTYDEKYRNRDNPAVALIKKSIARKQENRAASFEYYEMERYEKVMMGLSNVSEKFKNRKAFNKVQFLFEEMDTTSIKGQEILPIYLKENLSEIRYRKDPKASKELVLADTMVTFDGYNTNDAINQYLDGLYQNVDIYDNNVTILDQQFLSPIADNAPLFYKFFIQDTLDVDGTECIELFFAPRNNLDILFQGFIYIAHTDNFAVKKVDMSVNSNIGMNWVKSLSLVQEFERQGEEGYIQTKDAFSADFGLTKKGMGIYGSRTLSNQKIKINVPRPEEDYEGLDTEVAETAKEADQAFWEKNRHSELSAAEATTYEKIDSLQNVKVFKRAMTIATLVLSGYTKVTPYFEVGPVNTFYSFNPVEGLRLRFGGRTRPEFSEKFGIETYAAYGFTDKRWKGYLGFSQALKGGYLQKFPVRLIRASAQREVQIPGQALQFVQEDNILLSFKRGVNNKYLYNDIYRFDYINEYRNNVTISLGFKHWTQSPTLDLIYRKTGPPDQQDLITDLTTFEFTSYLRWAPKEQFFQGKNYRKRIYNKYPIFLLRYNMGIKDVVGSEYNYHNVSVNIFKRFFLSRLGYSDVYLEGGYTLGQVPYPLAMVHAGNQTFSYQLQGYNMMNFLEFVSDQYVSLNIDHDFNGFFFNRIPLIRKLKLRETFNVRVLYGGVRDENDPRKTDGLIAFPTDEFGNPTTFTLEDEPYVEASIGVANLFKFFRVDLVKRLNYLDNPNVSDLGVRARFKVYF